MNIDNNKITCIEGLRTIGWIGVFICHFKGAFFPNTSWWTDITPLKFIYSGNAYVRLLFVISGFVLSCKYFRKNLYENALEDIIKRYFRFMPPILVAELAVCFLMKIGALRNAEVAILTRSQTFLGIFNQFDPNWESALVEALFTTYFGSSSYIGPLWTMIYEYLGAMLILSAISLLKKTPWRWGFYFIFLSVFRGYYNYFVLGMMICDLYVNSEITGILKSHKVLHFTTTVLGYLMLSMVSLNDDNKYSRIIFGVGIVLFLIGILASSFAAKILGGSIMVKGGEIAYSAYIIHWPIIESFSCGLFLWLYGKNISYNFMISVIFAATLLIIVITAVIFQKIIEPLGVAFTRRITKVCHL